MKKIIIKKPTFFGDIITPDMLKSLVYVYLYTDEQPTKKYKKVSLSGIKLLLPKEGWEFIEKNPGGELYEVCKEPLLSFNEESIMSMEED